MSLIEAIGVSKSFQLESVRTDVLKNVDLVIEPEDRIAIIGASGAGKSTLLHILGSLEPPTSGRVLFEGADLYVRDEQKMSRLRNEAIGFVFQFHHLMPEFTAIENVMMPLLIRGRRKNEARKTALELLERLGLKERTEHLPAELSGGEQQRVAVARALSATPKVLFADEPTGNLDHENGERLVDLLLELQREHRTAMVLVTHNHAIAARFSKRVYLEDGMVARMDRDRSDQGG